MAVNHMVSFLVAVLVLRRPKLVLDIFQFKRLLREFSNYKITILSFLPAVSAFFLFLSFFFLQPLFSVMPKRALPATDADEH
jgi:hypothetical protein